MNHALYLNIAIILTVIVGMCVLHNPLALFALLLLKDMPYSLMIPATSTEEEEEPSKPMGFIQ